ncbi:Renin [Platysternon megacephalum]|uniref:Renin n=1 Tax=Platysternon megacephalum TaxID=55544 RepID=A0A4D9E4B2_9SAUR|nr:Renin [Platysternon megacephalum]
MKNYENISFIYYTPHRYFTHIKTWQHANDVCETWLSTKNLGRYLQRLMQNKRDPNSRKKMPRVEKHTIKPGKVTRIVQNRGWIGIMMSCRIIINNVFLFAVLETIIKSGL